MTSRMKLLAVLGVMSVGIGCAEAATNPLAPPESGSAIVLCNSELSPCDAPIDPVAPDPGSVVVNPCAECSGAPIILSTKAVVAIDAAGTITGQSEMEAWGNAYNITMTVGGSIPGGQSWTSPPVGDGYSSGLFTLGGASTRFSVRSPVAILATGQKCGLTATGYGTFKAEIRAPVTGLTWRQQTKSTQATPVLQIACADDTTPREVAVPSDPAGGGYDPIGRTELPTCWDYYWVSGNSWTYLYRICD